MRKLGVAAVCGLLATVAVPAIAQSPTGPGVTVTAKVTPNKAGTRRHPQGARLNTTIKWEQLGSAAQPIVQTFDVLFPKGSLYNGARTKSCSYGRLNADGPKACPKASIVGSGPATRMPTP